MWTIEKAAGDEQATSGVAADPACHPLAFSIVLTDQEPGTG